MSITDELRKYTEKQIKWLDMTKVHYRELFAIADRIDAEYQEAVASVTNDALYYANDKDMAECGWIRLPKDADGEYIHIGDVMESKGSDFLFGEASFEVRSMRHDECGWEVYDRLGDRYAPSLLRHHHAPTVEDVLTEFGIDWEHESDCEDRAALLKEYAKRLKLAGDEDA